MKEAIITSSALILGIVILRVALRGKISAKLQYALWLLVAVRLILPGVTAFFPLMVPESDFSLLNITKQADSAMESYLMESDLPYQMTFSKTILPFLTGSSDGPTSVFLAGHITWLTVLKGIWKIGMLCAAMWMGFVNLSFLRYLTKNRTPYPIEDFRLPVYLAEKLPSPCLYGFPGRQAVYITRSMAEDKEKLRHILAHEACHAVHGDTIWALLRCILLTVYWFHPLVWLAAYLSKKDCELACDEAVILKIGEEERISYGKTLLSLVTHSAKPADIVCTATTMTSGGKSMKERIDRIVHRPQMLAITAFFIIAIAAAAVVSTFTEASTPEIVTSRCFQLTLPKSLAKEVSCTVENETDIRIVHKKSNTEIGSFCALSLPEAQMTSEVQDIVLIGNYGANPSLRLYMDGKDNVTVHEYHPSSENDDQAADYYAISDAGVPGTDSAGNASDTANATEQEVSIDYLPNETITVTSFPQALYCYFYVPSADNQSLDTTEYARINSELISLVDTDSLSVLTLDTHSVEDTLEILVENRTPYAGNSINVVKITGALFVPAGLRYRTVELQTSTKPLKVILNYILTTDNLADIDRDMLRMNAALLFASVENADVCSFAFNDSAWVEYDREDMENAFGPLYPYSENIDRITELYNSLLSESQN